MKKNFLPTALCAAAAGLTGFAGPVRADDWPAWGRDRNRNPVSPEKNPPTTWDLKTGKNVKWTATLGTQSYGNPVVAGGLVILGTNNFGPRGSKSVDAGCLMIFRESDGEFLYQHVSPILKNGRVQNWPDIGLCTSALVEGERLWFVTNRCEVKCLDVTPLRNGSKEPTEVWKVDMRAELGVFPHNCTPCAIASYKDFIYVITGNGVDETHINKPAPDAPSLVCFNKNTGKVVWTDNSPGNNILHGQYSSPLVAEINGRVQCITPQGDGWIRSFDALTGKLIWKFDVNAKSTVFRPGGGSRNEIVATPVLYEGRIYIANGQDPEHGEGEGALYCIDPTKEGDISRELDDGPLDDGAAAKKGDDDKPAAFFGQPRKAKPNPNSGVVWMFDKRGKKFEDMMHRTISTVAVHQGLVFAPDLSGFFHCLDAKTGEKYWTQDTMSETWASPLIADGKVYLANADGDMYIFELSKTKKLIAKVNIGTTVYSSAVFANGVLYVMTGERLYAIQEKK